MFYARTFLFLILFSNLFSNINVLTIVTLLRDTTQLTMPEVKRVLLVGLNITVRGRFSNSESQEKIRPLLQLTFYLLDKLRRFKLSKEVYLLEY